MANMQVKNIALKMLLGAIHRTAGVVNAARTMFLLVMLFSFLLVSCAGGIFSSSNWQASGLQDQQLHVLEVGGKDFSTLYAGNAQGRIFVSGNAGQNWSEQSSGLVLPDVIHALSFDSGGQKLYAATDKGLFTKMEGATVWRKVSVASLPSAPFTSLMFLPDAPGSMYVGTASRGIFRSMDGGASWQAANGSLPAGIAVNDLSFDPVQKQVWAATSAGAYRSNNYGASWQAFNSGLPSTIVVNTIVPAAVGGSVQGMLYMGTDHGIFLSQDSGAHWTTNAEALSSVTIYHILIDFRAANSTSAYIATNLGAFYSTDAGQNWQSVAGGLPKSVPVYALVFGAANNAQLYAAGNGLYEFPGTVSTVDPLRIITYLAIAIFFFLLYRLVRSGRRARRDMLKPERIQDAPTSTPPGNSLPPAE